MLFDFTISGSGRWITVLSFFLLQQWKLEGIQSVLNEILFPVLVVDAARWNTVLRSFPPVVVVEAARETAVFIEEGISSCCSSGNCEMKYSRD